MKMKEDFHRTSEPQIKHKKCERTHVESQNVKDTVIKAILSLVITSKSSKFLCNNKTSNKFMNQTEF